MLRIIGKALMNTTQLECFVQVSDNLNFRRAADELHLSQSTVSKQIASLEDEMGGALFVRSTRAVALTALGESFLPDAREILRLMYASAEHARRAAEGKRLAIGYSDPTELMRLAVVLRKLHRADRSLSIELRLAPRDVNVEQLARKRLDLVLGYETASLEVSGTVFACLRDDSLSCVVPKGTKLAKLDAVGAEEVEGMPQVVCLPSSLRRRGYSASGSLPKSAGAITTRCQTTAEALCLVDAGLGYALLPTVQVMDTSGHRVVPWKDAVNARYGVYHRAAPDDESVSAFIEIAQECY